MPFQIAPPRPPTSSQQARWGKDSLRSPTRRWPLLDPSCRAFPTPPLSAQVLPLSAGLPPGLHPEGRREGDQVDDPPSASRRATSLERLHVDAVAKLLRGRNWVRRPSSSSDFVRQGVSLSDISQDFIQGFKGSTQLSLPYSTRRIRHVRRGNPAANAEIAPRRVLHSWKALAPSTSPTHVLDDGSLVAQVGEEVLQEEAKLLW